ncbi:hypothetical protein A6S26_05185 [Nostoc sp. ATCC 43529]|nr:hypothetical protein A6S26_05185 [Nostoc sp. ATCC 43529]
MRTCESSKQISLFALKWKPQKGQPMPWDIKQKLCKPKGGRNKKGDFDNFHNRDYDFVSPDGEVFTGKGIRRFAQEHGLCESALRNVLNGRLHSYKGWTKAIGGKKLPVPPTYCFLSPSGEVHTTTNLSEFARQHDLCYAALSRISRCVRGTHKGWRHCTPDGQPIVPSDRKHRKFTLLSPTGEIVEGSNLKAFAEQHGLSRGCLMNVLDGTSKEHKGWKLPVISPMTTTTAPNLGKLFTSSGTRPATDEDIALLEKGDWISARENPWSYQFKSWDGDTCIGTFEGKEFLIPRHILMVVEFFEGQVVEKFYRREPDSNQSLNNLNKSNTKPGVYIVDRQGSLAKVADDLGFGFVLDWLGFGEAPVPASGKNLTYNWERDDKTIGRLAIAPQELVAKYKAQNERTHQFKVGDRLMSSHPITKGEITVAKYPTFSWDGKQDVEKPDYVLTTENNLIHVSYLSSIDSTQQLVEGRSNAFKVGSRVRILNKNFGEYGQECNVINLQTNGWVVVDTPKGTYHSSNLELIESSNSHKFSVGVACFSVGDRVRDTFPGGKPRTGTIADTPEKYALVHWDGVSLENSPNGQQWSYEYLEKDDSSRAIATRWNPDHFGEVPRQVDASGQATIFFDDTGEPPEPDDFDTIEEFNQAWDEWEQRDVCTPEPSADENDGQKLVTEFRKGDKVAPAWPAGRGRRGVVEKVEKNFAHIEWTNGTSGKVRFDQLLLVERAKEESLPIPFWRSRFGLHPCDQPAPEGAQKDHIRCDTLPTDQQIRICQERIFQQNWRIQDLEAQPKQSKEIKKTIESAKSNIAFEEELINSLLPSLIIYRQFLDLGLSEGEAKREVLGIIASQTPLPPACHQCSQFLRQ